jgi:hypothetical protein
VTDKPVYAASRRLVDAGFLLVDWSKGRSSHRYEAALPPTSDELRRSEWATSELVPPTSDGVPSNIGRHPNESGLKAKESDGRIWKVISTCMGCNKEGVPCTDTGARLLCDRCLAYAVGAVKDELAEGKAA